MSDEIMQIANRIKGLRRDFEYSEESMAKELNISLTTYLQIESGEMDIQIGLLYKIASKFGIELAALISGENPRLHLYNIVRKGKGISVERRKQYKYESLAFNFIHKKVEPFLVTVDPDISQSKLSFHAHPGQEFNYLLEGTMKLFIDNHELILQEGDSVYFDSSFEHAMVALNNTPAKFLAIII